MSELEAGEGDSLMEHHNNEQIEMSDELRGKGIHAYLMYSLIKLSALFSNMK